MSREGIRFDSFEIFVGDTLHVSHSLKVINVVDIIEEQGKVYTVLQYGNSQPVLLEAKRLAYYITNNIYQNRTAAKYSIGQRFVHQYNNDTVRILASSPDATSKTKEYIYFCSLIDENGTFTYISVNESYFEHLIELDPAVEELPLPDIPIEADLPLVHLFIESDATEVISEEELNPP